ncbi:MAG: SDR family oxidoreductase [Chitinophagaceae bacterium]|nr:SDR family oxidoreductase [Chitinophagaceae bacterium]
MKIFISGASGLVGGNCQKYFIEKGENVLGTYFSYPVENTFFYDTLSPENPDNVDVEKFSPDVILHCGALTHVDYCEENVEESFQKTVQSTINLVALSTKLNSKFVFISTDYVFDGKAGPYKENDEVNPLSIYAKHKLEAENFVKEHCKNYLILRITNVYGDEIRNKNFVSRIIEQCVNKQKLILKLPYDQYATPINAWDIARALFLLLQDNKSGIYHISSTDWMNRVELAMNILKFFPDADYELIPFSTKELNQPASRPLLGGLIKEKFSAEYPEFIFSTVQDFVMSKNKK